MGHTYKCCLVPMPSAHSSAHIHLQLPLWVLLYPFYQDRSDSWHASNCWLPIKSLMCMVTPCYLQDGRGELVGCNRAQISPIKPVASEHVTHDISGADARQLVLPDATQATECSFVDAVLLYTVAVRVPAACDTPRGWGGEGRGG